MDNMHQASMASSNVQQCLASTKQARCAILHAGSQAGPGAMDCSHELQVHSCLSSHLQGQHPRR